MELSILEQLKKFLTIPFQSFLAIEILFIFVILFIFFIYNEKRKNKKVKIILAALIIFFFSLLVFYFSDDMAVVVSEIVKTALGCFYFPNLIFYIFTTIISLVLLIYTNFKSNLTKLNKIITYVFTILHLYLFTNFIAMAISLKLNLTATSNIYQHDDMYVIVFFSQIIFIILMLYKLIYHFYNFNHKLKNE